MLIQISDIHAFINTNGRKGKNADASAVVDAASVTDFGCKGKGRLKSYSEFRNLSEKLFKDLKGQTDEKLDFDG